VVHEALETIWWLGVVLFSLTPMTKVLNAAWPGPDDHLRRGFQMHPAFSMSVKRPVDSITYSTPGPPGQQIGVLVASTHLMDGRPR